MTLDKAKAALKALNVEEIEAEGLPFDPQCHAAVMQQPAPEGVESGTILAVMQRGYRRDGKVIRHAAVPVAEYHFFIEATNSRIIFCEYKKSNNKFKRSNDLWVKLLVLTLVLQTAVLP